MNSTFFAVGFAVAVTCGAALPVLAQQAPPAGTLGWGADNCQRQWTGRGWIRAGFCKHFPERGNQAVWQAYRWNDPARVPVHRLIEHTDGWVYQHNYADRSDSRFRVVSHQATNIQHRYNNVWISDQQFQTAAAQQTPQQPQSTIAATTPKSRAATPEELANYQVQTAAAKARIDRMWLAPACNSSYNGCR